MLHIMFVLPVYGQNVLISTRKCGINLILYSLVLVSSLEWKQIDYASITGPFPLKSKREGKVTQIITTQNDAFKQLLV